MSNDSASTLVRIATYPQHEDADTARSFLQHRGIIGVIVIDRQAAIEDEADQAFASGVYDLLVAAVDAPKAIVLLSEMWRLEGDAQQSVGQSGTSAGESAMTGELPEDLQPLDGESAGPDYHY